MRYLPHALPLFRIAIWGFVVNAFWEFGQCVLFYEMWSWGFWRGSVWMWGAILGDVVIVLGVVGLAHMIAGTFSLALLDRRGWALLLATGFVASVILEWAARTLGLWGYSPLMPTVQIAGYEVGLLPILQVSLLPALSVWLAMRFSICD